MAQKKKRNSRFIASLDSFDRRDNPFKEGLNLLCCGALLRFILKINWHNVQSLWIYWLNDLFLFGVDNAIKNVQKVVKKKAEVATGRQRDEGRAERRFIDEVTETMKSFSARENNLRRGSDEGRWLAVDGELGSISIHQFYPSMPHLSATLASTTAFGGTFHGQLIRPPGNRLKSNWQQILGSGPQVWGTS